MIIDKDLILSENQTVTSSVASTNYINQSASGDAADPLYFYVKTVGASTSDDPQATLKISLQCDDNSSFSSPKELMSVTFNLSDLSANKELIKVKMPVGVERYIRAYYTVTVGVEKTFSGTFTSFFVKDVKI